jgi:hypothetical protein
MKYTVITAKGRVLTFFIRAVAETYVQAYGGKLISTEILVDHYCKIGYNSHISSNK